MSSDRVITATRWLAILLAAAYAVSGLVGLFADIEPTRDLVIFVLLLWGGAILLAGGLVAFPSSPMLGAALMSVGALAGGLALVWSVIVPIAALALVVLSFMRARQPPAPPAVAR